MSTKRIKTVEEITKANLARTLKGMKTKVADREELWLEMFQENIGSLIAVEKYGSDSVFQLVSHAELIANTALDVYERRWGKG